MQGLGKRQKGGRLSVGFAIGIEVIDEACVMIDRVVADTMALSDCGIGYGERCWRDSSRS